MAKLVTTVCCVFIAFHVSKCDQEPPKLTPQARALYEEVLQSRATLSCTTEPNFRFDCLPDSDISSDGSLSDTRSECNRRGCCWDNLAVESEIIAPETTVCYYPSNYK